MGLLLLFASLGCKASPEAFTVVKVDLGSEDLRLFWRDETGTPFRRFDRLASWLGGQKKQLLFGMNAGMYHADASPVGLLVLEGTEVSPLNLSIGQGNFFLRPNGVFMISAAGPQVVEASEYRARARDVRFATQSGPLLLKGGKIHSALRATSSSRLIRNGVCASGNVAVFVISAQPVNFYEFATFFRDELHCQDALYLDGVVSSLHSVSLGRSDLRAELGPMFGVIR